MVTGVTTSGFEFELEDEIFDDYDLLEMLCKIDSGNTGLVPEMIDQLLGESQKEKLKNHIRSEGGKVSAKRLMAEVGEIFKACKDIKN